jgi:hypothetical protein
LLEGKPEGKKPSERPGRRCVDIIKMDLEEKGWGGINWINLIPDSDRWTAVVNTVMNLWVPLNAGEFLSSCTSGGVSRRDQLLGGCFILNRQVSRVLAFHKHC